MLCNLCMAGKGSAGAAQALLNHWSSSDYLQLVTEKVTAFEREQRELSMVLFGQVSTTSTALVSVYDTTCAEALCTGSESSSAQSPCTMTGMPACSNSYISSSACVCSVVFCNRPRCSLGSMSLYETETGKMPAPVLRHLICWQSSFQPDKAWHSPSVQMHASYYLLCHRRWRGLLSWTEW